METKPENLIGDISYLEIVNDKIYILDKKSNAIYIYTTTGKFLKKIYAVGTGPDEYIKLYSMYLSPVHNYILTYCNQLKKIIFYDLDGNFLGAKNIGFWVKDFSLLESGQFSYYVNNEYNLGNLILTNNELVPIKKGIKGKYNDTKGLNFYQYRPFIKDYKNSKLIMPTLLDTLYQFDLTSSSAKYALNYGKKRIPKEYFFLDYNSFCQKIENENFYYSMGSYFETNDLVGFSIGEKKVLNSFLYSKKSKHIYFGKLLDSNTGLEIPFPEYSRTSQPLSYLFPDQLLNYYANCNGHDLPNNFKQLCKSLKKYDNPVILVLDFKAF